MKTVNSKQLIVNRKPFVAILAAAFLLGGAFFLAPEAKACTTSKTNLTIGSSCSFPKTADGVENGNLTYSADLTILSGQTIVFNQGFSLVKSGSGRIIKGSTGVIKKSFLWATDGDNDGYADNLTWQVSDTTPSSSRRIRDTIDLTTADCSPSDATTWQNRSCYLDNDCDGYTSASTTSVCSGSTCGPAPIPVCPNTPASGCYRATASGTADCNDASCNATSDQCYSYGYAQAYYYGYGQAYYYGYGEGYYYGYGQAYYYGYGQAYYYGYGQAYYYGYGQSYYYGYGQAYYYGYGQAYYYGYGEGYYYGYGYGQGYYYGYGYGQAYYYGYGQGYYEVGYSGL